ncbi:MAG TPA: ABC transporter permease subunit [Acidimicrobiales bacterium]|nr:ABC transporter permease subunit [Acidimicrobiales bacterium]
MIAVELARQVRRRRTFICFLFLVGLPVIAALANRSRSPSRTAEIGTRALFEVSTASGINHALAALAFMSAFFLVIVVSFFAGDSVAGEASWGTLRYLLIRPVTRGRLLATKLAVVLALALAATVAVAVSGLVSGTVAFGWDGVVTPFGPTMPVGESLLRLAAATLAVTWSLGAVLCFAFLLSVVTDSPAAAITGGFGLMIVSTIFDGLSSLDFLHPGLPTHYWGAWSRLFLEAPPTAAPLFGGSLPDTSLRPMAQDALVQLTYAVVFIGAAAWWFRRKDIVS